MPSKPRRPCSVCGAMIPTFTLAPKCDGCKGAKRRQEFRLYNAKRGTSAERGYDYAHSKRAKACKKENPFCVGYGQPCGRPATTADHVWAIKLGGPMDGPLQSMCDPCHGTKTAAESKEFERREQIRLAGGVL